MADTPSAPIRLDAYQSTKWHANFTPVAILNTESTLHQRIAYCWGLAHQLVIMSDFLIEHQNPEFRQIGELFDSQLQPLVTLLDKLGADTRPSS